MKDWGTVLLERVNEETRVREIIRENLLSFQIDETGKKTIIHLFLFFEESHTVYVPTKIYAIREKKSQQLFQNSKREDKAGSRR